MDFILVIAWQSKIISTFRQLFCSTMRPLCFKYGNFVIQFENASAISWWRPQASLLARPRISRVSISSWEEISVNAALSPSLAPSVELHSTLLPTFGVAHFLRHFLYTYTC